MNILLIGNLISQPAGYTLLGVIVAAILIYRLFEWRYFLHGTDATSKRKYFRWSTIIGLVIGVLLALIVFPLGEALTLVVTLAIGGYLGLRNTKFCDACGKLNRDPLLWGPPDYCNKCGVHLNQKVTA